MFTARNSAPERILRINADGSIDPSFNAVEVGRFEIGYIWMLTAQPDGKILASGSFLSFAGSSRQKIVRLLSDGNLDGTFNPPQFSTSSGIWARPIILSDGRIVVAGDFTTLNGSASRGVARASAGRGAGLLVHA